MTTASTATSYEQQGLLHHMFTRQAKYTPEKIAIVEESGKQITFSDLDEKSDLLGRHLVHTGVTPNACVGMYLNKSIEYTTAYIAILKAGGYIFISFFYLFIRNSSGFMHGVRLRPSRPIENKYVNRKLRKGDTPMLEAPMWFIGSSLGSCSPCIKPLEFLINK
jgi:hypothetical protein